MHELLRKPRSDHDRPEHNESKAPRTSLPALARVELDDEWGEARSKTVRWHDPTVLGAVGAELPGREFLQAIIDGRLPPPPIATLIGAELVSIGEGEAVFRCVPDESAYNPICMVHGGLLCTLLDSAAGCAVHTLLPPGTGYGTIEIKVSFLNPLRADSGQIQVHGRALRVGRRIAFAEAHARHQNGELVGHATTSIAVSRPHADARSTTQGP
jgi:uncharacterized protein (TIGR00369 family)